MVAHQVRDVEALDPHRDLLHPERPLEPVERLDPLRAAALRAQPVLVEREPRVALGQLEDAALVAALGVADLHRRAAPLGERLGERVESPTERCTTTCGGTAIALA